MNSVRVGSIHTDNCYIPVLDVDHDIHEWFFIILINNSEETASLDAW